jgi:hypothetical protein
VVVFGETVTGDVPLRLGPLNLNHGVLRRGLGHGFVSDEIIFIVGVFGAD